MQRRLKKVLLERQQMEAENNLSLDRLARDDGQISLLRSTEKNGHFWATSQGRDFRCRFLGREEKHGVL